MRQAVRRSRVFRKIKESSLAVGIFVALFAAVWFVWFCLPYVWGIKPGGKAEMLTTFSLLAAGCFLCVIGLREPKKKP